MWQAPLAYYQRLTSTYSLLPEVCWKEITIDDFQQKQCKDFWNTLVLRSGLGLLPVLGMLLSLVWTTTSFFGFYARARKKANKGKPDVGGVIVQLTEGRGWLGWLYGFKAVRIELADKKQAIVYLPADVPIPGIGYKLIAFNVSRGPWEEVYLAAPYTPHVAVVRGV